MWDWEDRIIAGLFWLMGIALVGLIGFMVADGLSTAEGTVVNKYYDDPDLVCGKVCVPVEECWTLIIDSEPWWNDDTCVSEEYYNTVKIGDYYRE